MLQNDAECCLSYLLFPWKPVLYHGNALTKDLPCVSGSNARAQGLGDGSRRACRDETPVGGIGKNCSQKPVIERMTGFVTNKSGLHPVAGAIEIANRIK